MTAPLTKAELKLIRKIAERGGHARAKSLTRARRKEIAMMGVAARAAKRNGNGR